jgi:hypothetical protein
MTRTAIAGIILGTAAAFAYSQTQPVPSFKPRDGFVPNAETAVKIGEAVLIPVYGKNTILHEEPFHATREGDVWTVAGTLNCGAPQCWGGTAVVKISKTSGEILSMIHYK